MKRQSAWKIDAENRAEYRRVTCDLRGWMRNETFRLALGGWSEGGVNDRCLPSPIKLSHFTCFPSGAREKDKFKRKLLDEVDGKMKINLWQTCKGTLTRNMEALNWLDGNELLKWAWKAFCHDEAIERIADLEASSLIRNFRGDYWRFFANNLAATRLNELAPKPTLSKLENHLKTLENFLNYSRDFHQTKISNFHF